MSVVIETTLGDITVDLYLDQRPVTCLNFLKLCKMKYYNFNLFHSIRSGFIAQTGDPTAEGSNGESIFGLLEGPDKRFFSGEKLPKIRHTNTGTLSMVCTGDMMVGSQFFFTLAPDLDSLDGIHCVIGEVTEGHDVLRKLNDVICDETHRPYRDVRITHTVVLEDPFNDPPGLRAPSRSPSPSAERLKGGRIAPDEDIEDAQGKSAQEVQEIIDEKEAKARATILEIVGDLPDADIAPPENVLFVCKLNPVTTDEDLEIIFSRFGTIVGCEVIRDKKTGDSLQYAFIEFADKKSCEDAYFKMDNVLIDDRRIHVDFSQSVSRMRWMGKGKGIKYYNNNGPKEKVEQNSSSRKSHDQDRGDQNNGKIGDDQIKQRRSRSRDRSYHADKKDGHSKNERTERHDRHRKSDRDRSRRERSRSRSYTGRHRSKRDRSRDKSRTEKSDRDRSRKNRSRSRDRSRKDRSRSKDRPRHKSRKNRSESRDRSKRHNNEKLSGRDRSRKGMSRSRDRTSPNEDKDDYRKDRSISRTQYDDKNERLSEKDKSKKHRSRSRDKSSLHEDKIKMLPERDRTRTDSSGSRDKHHKDSREESVRKEKSSNPNDSPRESSSQSTKNQLEEKSRNSQDETDCASNRSRELEISQQKTSENDDERNTFRVSYWAQLPDSMIESETTNVHSKTSKSKDVCLSNTEGSQSNDRHHSTLEKFQPNNREDNTEKHDEKPRYDSETKILSQDTTQKSHKSQNKSPLKYSEKHHSDSEENQHHKQNNKKTDDGKKSKNDTKKQKQDDQPQSSKLDRKSELSKEDKSHKSQKVKDHRTPTPVINKKGKTTKKVSDKKIKTKVLKKKRKHSTTSSDSSSESSSSSDSSSSEEERKKKAGKLRKRKITTSSSSSSSSTSSSSSSDSSSTSSSSDSELDKKKRKKIVSTKGKVNKSRKIMKKL